jgi:hypothetical protein
LGRLSDERGRTADMDEALEPTVPEEAIDGDVMVLMGGRLYVVDHVVPEALTIDLTALAAEHETAARADSDGGAHDRR